MYLLIVCISCFDIRCKHINREGGMSKNKMLIQVMYNNCCTYKVGYGVCVEGLKR